MNTPLPPPERPSAPLMMRRPLPPLRPAQRRMDAVMKWLGLAVLVVFGWVYLLASGIVSSGDAIATAAVGLIALVVLGVVRWRKHRRL